ncbi:hypothetical protein [Mycoplasmopsis cynos]|uniref:hypothetical protein n=1 Tax=Mycoplasmopsis cynos TaxID=171284 RepID=UPI0025412D68|nr:hypothetical protein [Mycoplasmopsis cynos]MCU9934818.1 hypothetical protein [Mycoplasmopsis cynos]
MRYRYWSKNLLEVRIELINSKNEIFYSDPGIFNPKDKTIVFALDKLPKDTIYTFRSIKILEQKRLVIHHTKILCLILSH